MFSIGTQCSKNRERIQRQQSTMLEKTMRCVCALMKNPFFVSLLLTCDVKWQHTFPMKLAIQQQFLHYSSRCEQFAFSRFFNKSQKNIKKSLVQEVSQKSDISVHRIFLFYNIFNKKKAVFSEKTMKNCLGILFQKLI